MSFPTILRAFVLVWIALGAGAAIARDKQIGLCLANSDSPYGQAVYSSVKDEATRLNFKLSTSDAQSSAAKQLTDVESLISQGSDVIILEPVDADALLPAIDKVQAEGIPVILIQRNIDVANRPAHLVPFVGPDPTNDGKRAAEWLSKNAEGRTNTIVLLDSNDDGKQSLKEGFKTSLSSIPAFKILDSIEINSAGADMSGAVSPASSDPEVIFAQSRDIAMGAIQALGSRGRSSVWVMFNDEGTDYGPKVFEVVSKLLAGQPAPEISAVDGHLVIFDGEHFQCAAPTECTCKSDNTCNKNCCNP
ncbi:substrate-binding domain-containing protein [Rhizobium leguminosarum]